MHSLAPITTQHALTTQVIDIYSNMTANATTYVTVSQFGRGPYQGQAAYTYAKYLDALRFNETWKIYSRTFVYMVLLDFLMNKSDGTTD